jgi:aspartate/tyrosine/aromatic aminotransferase
MLRLLRSTNTTEALMSYFTVQDQHLCGVTEENYNKVAQDIRLIVRGMNTAPPKHGAAVAGVVRPSGAEECKRWKNGRQNEYLK